MKVHGDVGESPIAIDSRVEGKLRRLKGSQINYHIMCLGDGKLPVLVTNTNQTIRNLIEVHSSLHSRFKQLCKWSSISS